MPTTLVILAHPDPRSFNGTWAEATRAASEAAGHEVLWSDLVSMGFDPVERAAHYAATDPAASFDPLKAQEAAAASGRLPPDVTSEIDKLRRADRVVFHFPVWWFAPPAILKGWLDRVLAHGETHSVGARFDKGQFRGRKALFCVTTGSSADESAHNGKEGDIRMLLWPMAYTLRYLGFSVVEPKIVHGVHGYHRDARKTALDARLREFLDSHATLIAAFDTLPLMPFNADTDFDADGRLKSDAPSNSRFIRHEP